MYLSPANCFSYNRLEDLMPVVLGGAFLDVRSWISSRSSWQDETASMLRCICLVCQEEATMCGHSGATIPKKFRSQQQVFPSSSREHKFCMKENHLYVCINENGPSTANIHTEILGFGVSLGFLWISSGQFGCCPSQPFSHMIWDVNVPCTYGTHKFGIHGFDSFHIPGKSHFWFAFQTRSDFLWPLGGQLSLIEAFWLSLLNKLEEVAEPQIHGRISCR